MRVLTWRTRLPLWQSVVISVVTAAAAVTTYALAFVDEPPPPPAPVVIAMPAPAPLACPPPPPPRVVVVPERTAPDAVDSERARLLFEDAVNLLRRKENDEGCRLLERVATMPGGGQFADKAQSLLERRCE